MNIVILSMCILTSWERPWGAK